MEQDLYGPSQTIFGDLEITMSMRYLVLHDVDAIQGYVFATDYLQEIQGASSLIDYLNRKMTRDLVIGPDHLIYANGGGAAADFAESEDAFRFCQQVANLYVDQTVIASSTGVVQKYDPGADDGFKHALRMAHQQLRQQKACRSRQAQVLSSPFFKRCESCGIYPAATHDSHEPAGFLCAGCSRKREHRRHRPTDQPKGVHQHIHGRIRRDYQTRVRFPQYVDEIGRKASPEGYIGVIYADGNRMGEYLQHIGTSHALRQFSKTIDDAVTEAIAATLARHYGPALASQAADSQGRHLLPAVVPLCGGDDLVALVPGQDALKVALNYLERFQQEVKDHLSRDDTTQLTEMIKTRELSACAGVAIAKSHTPLSRLLDLAHDLCQQAKTRSHHEAMVSGAETPCVDFQVITTPNWEEVGLVRKGPEYQLTERLRLTARPYTLVETRNLINAIHVMKRSKFPSGKLHDLYNSLRSGEAQAQLEYLTLYVRASKGEQDSQQAALSFAEELLKVEPSEAPWRTQPDGIGKETAYGDLVEIYAFIAE